MNRVGQSLQSSTILQTKLLIVLTGFDPISSILKHIVVLESLSSFVKAHAA